MTPPHGKTTSASSALLAGVQDNPAISASARCRAARGREDRQAILTNLRFCGARRAPAIFSFPSGVGGLSARPAKPQMSVSESGAGGDSMAQQVALNIDCLEYMRTLPDKAFDLAIVDPPYGGGGTPCRTSPAGGLADSSIAIGKITRTLQSLSGRLRGRVGRGRRSTSRKGVSLAAIFLTGT